MQRSLMQVVETDQRHRLIRGLVEHIHDNEGFSPDGCPLLFLYAYARSRSLSCQWLHGMLRYLRDIYVVREKNGHYRVNGYEDLVKNTVQ
jgi:hypothetical protein